MRTLHNEQGFLRVLASDGVQSRFCDAPFNPRCISPSTENQCLCLNSRIPERIYRCLNHIL
jgi:hypothetical protein